MENFEIDDKELGISGATKSPLSKSFLILMISILFLILIALVILFIVLYSNNKSVNNDNIIFINTKNYIMNLTKQAITGERIKHLFQNKYDNDSNVYFEKLFQITKEIIEIGFNQMQILNKYENIINESDNLITKFLSFPKNEANISLKLFNLSLKKDNTIDDYSKDENIKYILNNIENQNFQNKYNLIILYIFINLPMQLGFFSKDASYKSQYLSKIISQMTNISSNNEIIKNINQNMSKISDEKDKIYMVLGANQKEEYNRITSKLPYINICNTGIRTQSVQSEIDNYLKDNIENYYTNINLRNLMEQSTIDGNMSDEIYENFINECNNLKNNITQQNAIEVFSKFNFSVETANTVIEYLKLNVSLENIIIIRLGLNIQQDIKYDKNKVYILFNVIDVSDSIYHGEKGDFLIKRATTLANVKAINYLKNECKNFFKEGDYKNLILVSTKGSAERQLEAFNIEFSIFNYGINWDYIIWNENNSGEFDIKKIINCLIEFMVKSFNLICDEIQRLKIEEYEREKKEELLEINEFINNSIVMTNSFK